MTVLSTHFPNRKLETNELARIRALGCQAYTVFVPNLGDVSYWVQVCKDIRTAQPSAQIHLRLEKRGSLGDPRSECLNEAAVVNQFYNTIDTWTWRNEVNNEVEAPTSITAAQWQTWLTIFLTQAKASILPPVAAPPISPGSRDAAGFLAATVQAAHAAGVTRRHIHFYGSPDVAQGDMQRERNASPNDTLYGTEYNFGEGNSQNLSQYVLDMPEVCRRAAALKIKTVGVFIWQRFQPPPNLPTTVNIRDTVVEAGMKSMQKFYAEPTPPSGGALFTLDEMKRLAADIWRRAGVVYTPGTAFADYWFNQWLNGTYIGDPREQEHKSESVIGGYWLQQFASEYLWAPLSNPNDVHRGHPPFS